MAITFIATSTLPGLLNLTKPLIAELVTDCKTTVTSLLAVLDPVFSAVAVTIGAYLKPFSEMLKLNGSVSPADLVTPETTSTKFA